MLKVGDLSIAESFIALQLNGVEVVLGMQWLFTWVSETCCKSFDKSFNGLIHYHRDQA